jgi:catechol 2,3-dioxygenase-like lactoylglutathione lyase family enzyme
MAKTATTDERFQFRGVNHVALVARDMAETVDFYENILDMPLIMSVGIPGGGQHFFFDCGNGATIAFFWFKDAPPVAPGIASQHRDVAKNGAKTAHGSMNHLAIDIAPENFDSYLERLRARGVECSVINHNDPPLEHSIEFTEHSWIRSMYFFDPNGIKLEFAALLRDFNENDILMAPFDADGNPVERRELVKN